MEQEVWACQSQRSLGVLTVYLGRRQNSQFCSYPWRTLLYVLPPRGYFSQPLKGFYFKQVSRVLVAAFLKHRVIPVPPVPPCPSDSLAKQRDPQEPTAPRCSWTLLQAPMLSRAPSPPAYLYLENVVASTHGPPQKKTPIKGEIGPAEDSGSEIQPASGITGRIKTSRKHTRNKNGFPPPTHPSST